MSPWRLPCASRARPRPAMPTRQRAAPATRRRPRRTPPTRRDAKPQTRVRARKRLVSTSASSTSDAEASDSTHASQMCSPAIITGASRASSTEDASSIEDAVEQVFRTRRTPRRRRRRRPERVARGAPRRRAAARARKERKPRPSTVAASFDFDAFGGKRLVANARSAAAASAANARSASAESRAIREFVSERLFCRRASSAPPSRRWHPPRSPNTRAQRSHPDHRRRLARRSARRAIPRFHSA